MLKVTALATMDLPQPACEDCHEDIQPGGEIEQHDQDHLEKMACQTCHSAGAYKSCFGCHTGIDSKDIKYLQHRTVADDFQDRAESRSRAKIARGTG